jgi:flagellar basal-body rod protein FlgG
VTATGAKVLGAGGAIQIPKQASSVSIDPSGNVTAQDASANPPVTMSLGRVRVVTFPKDVKLNPVGYACYAPDPPETAGAEAAGARVRQGCLEQSNVNVIDEMVRMMMVARDFESAQRALRSIDDAQQKLTESSSRTV